MSEYQRQGYDPRQQRPATPPGWGQQPGYPPPFQPQQGGQVQPYGYQQPGPVRVAPRSPALGLIVSIFLPGVGSMMAGKTGKGIGILIGWLIGWLLCLVLIGFVIMPVFWIWGLVAAYTDAVGWNRDHGIIS
jgi:TM2 domain-containing membrane protein YozV